MARQMRAARIGPDSDRLRGLAGKALIDAGRPQSVKAQLQVLLDTVRARTVYMPDPVAAEYVVAPAGTLCVRPGLCVPAGDCDDLTTALGALCLVSGIPVRIVKQSWGSSDQEHVLIEAQDEYGNWIAADPSSDWPAGIKAPCTSEVTVDPMNDQQIGLLADTENNFVGVGGLPRTRFLAMRTAAPVGAGGILPTFVTAHTVQELKDRLNGFVSGLNSAVSACASIPAPLKDAWASFYAQWAIYYAQTPSFWSAAADMDEAEAWEKDVQGWQQQLAALNCAVGPTAATWNGDATGATAQLVSVVRALAIGVGVVAGGIIVYKGLTLLAPLAAKK